MSFIPDRAEWIRARVERIPQETSKYCGDLAGLEVLDVGCGDMMADIGLLSLGPRHITGIDVLVRDWDLKERAAENIRGAGFTVSGDYASRLTYVTYNGTRFPFPDNCFDLVFSWGVFEHVPDVPAVLQEMRRVAKPEGRIFVVVYPWFHCYTGSHLSDFIDEPFFHLTRPKEWVYGKLKEFVARQPDSTVSFQGFDGPEYGNLSQFVLEHMWKAYCTLNRYSARMLLTDAMRVGLSIEWLQSLRDEEHVQSAPACVDVADVVAAGTTVVFRPGKSYAKPQCEATSTVQEELASLRRALESERKLREGIEQSVSWRLTRPARDLMRFFRNRRLG